MFWALALGSILVGGSFGHLVYQTGEYWLFLPYFIGIFLLTLGV